MQDRPSVYSSTGRHPVLSAALSLGCLAIVLLGMSSLNLTRRPGLYIEPPYPDGILLYPRAIDISGGFWSSVHCRAAVPQTHQNQSKEIWQAMELARRCLLPASSMFGNKRPILRCRVLDVRDQRGTPCRTQIELL